MPFSTPDPVPSGQVFAINSVNGQRPTGLDDFVGQAAFAMHWDGQDRVVTGQGSRTGPGVRFHEKDADSGKDVRVWTIGPTDEPDHYTACT